MKKFIIILIFITISSFSLNIFAAKQLEPEEQALNLIQTSLIHGQLGEQSLTEMIKFIEQAVKMSDGSSKLKEEAMESLKLSNESLTKLQMVLKKIEEISNIQLPKPQ